MPAEWPYVGYTGPQPWEVQNPPSISHDRPLLTAGSAGDPVVELANCLSWLGISCSITEGANPHALFDPTVRAAVNEFRRVYGVAESPEIVRATTPAVVGPWTWEALFRAVRSAQAQVE